MKNIFKAKHYFLAAIICLASFYNVYAEKEKPSKSGSKKEIFAFGPKVAINFTNLNKSIDKEFLPGADLGLFFRFSIARFYIQPEVNYVIRNTNIKLSSFDISNLKYETQHINVPVFLGYKIVDFKLFKFRIFVGPEFNFQLPKNSNMLNNRFQLGFQAGLGFDIWRFTIDGGYSFLADIEKGVKGVHNNIFKVGVGFKCF